MKRFIEGDDREQGVLFPDHLEDFVGEDNPVRAVDAFVDALTLVDIGFSDAAATGRPGYHPAVLLKIYVYGYLNRIQSRRRLELEAGRNVEMMWLTGRLAPDFKTIADFRRDNSKAIRKVCSQFVMLCRQVGLLNGDCRTLKPVLNAIFLSWMPLTAMNLLCRQPRLLVCRNASSNSKNNWRH